MERYEDLYTIARRFLPFTSDQDGADARGMLGGCWASWLITFVLFLADVVDYPWVMFGFLLPLVFITAVKSVIAIVVWTALGIKHYLLFLLRTIIFDNPIWTDLF